MMALCLYGQAPRPSLVVVTELVRRGDEQAGCNESPSQRTTEVWTTVK